MKDEKSAEYNVFKTEKLTIMDENRIIDKALAILERRMVKGPPIRGTAFLRKYLCVKYADAEREFFDLILLDNQHRVLSVSTLFMGTIDGASVYPREIVKEALHKNAAAVILAHNHPSATPVFSESDYRITRKIKAALETVEIRTLDSVVVAGTELVSMAEKGKL